jgi:hypothetical protein
MVVVVVSVVMMAVVEAVAVEIVVLVVIEEETADLHLHLLVVEEAVEEAVEIVVHHVETTVEVHPQARAVVVVENAGETVASSAIKVVHAMVVALSKADMVVEAVDRLVGTPSRLVQHVHPGHLNQPSRSLKKKSQGQFHYAHSVS